MFPLQILQKMSKCWQEAYNQVKIQVYFSIGKNWAEYANATWECVDSVNGNMSLTMFEVYQDTDTLLKKVSTFWERERYWS